MKKLSRATCYDESLNSTSFIKCSKRIVSVSAMKSSSLFSNENTAC
uniref:Uncharacterized protein n=1 Tax=Lepeophtheirus salmonis TaxID=72036 RepID=A0A0K2UWG0_LEPSM